MKSAAVAVTATVTSRAICTLKRTPGSKFEGQVQLEGTPAVATMALAP